MYIGRHLNYHNIEKWHTQPMYVKSHEMHESYISYVSICVHLKFEVKISVEAKIKNMFIYYADFMLTFFFPDYKFVNLLGPWRNFGLEYTCWGPMSSNHIYGLKYTLPRPNSKVSPTHTKKGSSILHHQIMLV